MTISIRMETDDGGTVLGVQHVVDEDKLRQATSPRDQLQVEYESAESKFKQQLIAWAETYGR